MRAALWAYLWRVTGDLQHADDLLQETFYWFLRAASVAAADRERFDSEAHRRNSLNRIAGQNLVKGMSRVQAKSGPARGERDWRRCGPGWRIAGRAGSGITERTQRAGPM